MKNQDVREALDECGVKHWELAERLGKCPSWLSYRLRHELPNEEKYILFKHIQDIVDERKVNA